MVSIWKIITLLAVVLLAGLSACQSSTPAPSPVLPSATSSPKATPSAKRIAFYSTAGDWQNSKSDIFLINADGSNLVRLSYGVEPYWSPDGKKIAFGVWVVNVDGLEKQRLIYINQSGTPLAWSSDGQRVAFATRQGNFAGSIYVVDVKTAINGDTKGALKQLVKDAVDAYDLAWSPDGQKLLFSYSKDPDSPRQIAILDIAASASEPNDRRKWKVLAEGWTPMWSPDGKKIAYEFASNIYEMEADGSHKKQLTVAGGITPVWSPDGQQIAFQSSPNGILGIYVMNKDGTHLKKLIDNQAALYTAPTLSWSPDSKQIAFVSKHDGNQEIYVMDADGSNLLRLTNNDVDDWGPVWQPQPKP